LLFVLAILLVSFSVFSLVFYKENEHRAAGVSLLFATFIGIILVFSLTVDYQLLDYIVIGISIIVMGILLIPFKHKIKAIPGIVLKSFDERDVMFSRMELKKGTPRFEAYYKSHPEKKILDDIFRTKAGLLSKKATEYHPLKFASAEANFMAVDNFKVAINENLLSPKQTVDAREISLYIKKWLKQIGATSVGITELKAHQLYSNKGRGDEYGNEVVNTHKFAIAFTVEMDKDMLDKAPKAEAIMESSQQYLEAAKIATQLTYFIRNLGYTAKPHIDGNYDLICPVVAKDAGLVNLDVWVC